jgi:hypothetical protein
MTIETILPVARILGLISAQGSAQVWIARRYRTLTAQNLRRVPGLGDAPDTFVFSVDDVKPFEVPATHECRVIAPAPELVERVVDRRSEVTVAVSSLRLTEHPHYRTVLAETVRVEYRGHGTFRYHVSGTQVRKDGSRSRLPGTIVFRPGEHDVDVPEWVRELGERHRPVSSADQA